MKMIQGGQLVVASLDSGANERRQDSIERNQAALLSVDSRREKRRDSNLANKKSMAKDRGAKQHRHSSRRTSA